MLGCSHLSATGANRPPIREEWFGKILASFTGCGDLGLAGDWTRKELGWKRVGLEAFLRAVVTVTLMR